MQPRRYILLLALLCVTALTWWGAKWYFSAKEKIAEGTFLVPAEEKDPAKYPGLLAKWSSTGLVGHFPKTIPAQASHVHLSAFPGFLQGGAFLQIRYQLPPAEVATIYSEATKTAKTSYDGGNKYELVNDTQLAPGSLAGTSFYTGDTDSERFPTDYRIFVFAAEDHGGMWNHGNSQGIVVSTQRNEVIYFAENW